MPIGRHHVVYHSEPLTSPKHRAYRRIVGVNEFHSHIRWAAIRRWVDPTAKRTLEVGAGEGLMTVEIARMVQGTVLASEFDARLIDMMKLAVAEAGLTNVTTSQDDLRTLSVGVGYDQVLMIDVLEHIDDHEQALAQVADTVRPGGRLIVSVPTPRYPVVFGRAFHESIGHVRDGYPISDLAPLLNSAGFDVREHRYYTGPVASLVCSAFYRSGRFSRGQKAVIQAVAKPLSLATERLAWEANAASLAVLAVRR